MLRTDDLDFALPEELIATRPAEPRDAARLLVVSRSDPARIEHRLIRDLPDILRPPDLRSAMPPDVMVVNATRVLPARFRGVRADTNGQVEGLYVQPALTSHEHANRGPIWIVLLKMRRLRPGVLVNLLDRHDRDSGVRLRLIERVQSTSPSSPAAGWIVLVESESLALTPGLTAADLLEFIGLTPVPPYILAARRKHHDAIADDRDRATYQTVYASTKDERPGHGSVAAPTAGLHFTPDLLLRLRDSGVRQHDVTLDVGLGTFKPVETEFIEHHPMHSEWCYVPQTTASAIAAAHAQPPAPRGRVLAIGTTAARTLESFDTTDEMLRVRCKDTSILISPGYQFKHVEAMLTNFHLPQTTLLAMVAAFLASRPGLTSASASQSASGGTHVPPESPPQPTSSAHAVEAISRLKHIYAQAIAHRYRFYSFGDAMLILP
ncbi:MAG: S-adenosylmethionine:tRNA ribosyltransferase-isomerase [Phycisphaerales bacterium]|nr:S-adenosylmethionine:tRNA ribosyltransferase-isomerase [Phycisphaerales bacterium]